jgi:hypothetical protein
MRPERAWRAAALAVLAAAIPACHDDDDDGDGFGVLEEPVTVRSILSGAQENPPVATGGRGAASVTVRPGGAAMAFTLEVSALSNITAAHIHAGTPGVNGPILFTLSPGPFAGSLSGTLAASDLDATSGMTFAQAVQAIREGRTYVNVHTTQHPDGEIRGHLGPAVFQATLSGSEEVPPVSTGATGLATVTLNGEQTELAVTLEFSGLGSSPAAAHIHVGARGANGPIVFTLATAPLSSPVRRTLTAADLEPRPAQGIRSFEDAVDAILSGNAYVNVHSASNPGGEIRGQLAPR